MPLSASPKVEQVPFLGSQINEKIEDARVDCRIIPWLVGLPPFILLAENLFLSFRRLHIPEEQLPRKSKRDPQDITYHRRRHLGGVIGMMRRNSDSLTVFLRTLSDYRTAPPPAPAFLLPNLLLSCRT